MFDFIKYSLIIFGLWTGWNWVADNHVKFAKHVIKFKKLSKSRCDEDRRSC